jgi:hypothetical protein
MAEESFSDAGFATTWLIERKFYPKFTLRCGTFAVKTLSGPRSFSLHFVAACLTGATVCGHVSRRAPKGQSGQFFGAVNRKRGSFVLAHNY